MRSNGEGRNNTGLKRDLLADCTWSLCSISPITGTPSHCIWDRAGNLPLAALYFLKEVKKQSSPLSDTHLSQAVSMETLSVSTNSFSLDLYKKLNETSKGQNIFFSPWNIATALAMVYLGAKGDTATQMTEVSSEISSISPYRWFPHKLHYSSAYGQQKGTTWEIGDLP